MHRATTLGVITVAPSAGMELGVAAAIFTESNPRGQLQSPVMRFRDRQPPNAPDAVISCCQAPPNTAVLWLNPNGRHNPIVDGRNGGFSIGGCVLYAQSEIVASGCTSSCPAGQEHEPVSALAPSSGHHGQLPYGGAARGEVLVMKPPPEGVPLLYPGVARCRSTRTTRRGDTTASSAGIFIRPLNSSVGPFVPQIPRAPSCRAATACSTAAPLKSLRRSTESTRYCSEVYSIYED